VASDLLGLVHPRLEERSIGQGVDRVEPPREEDTLPVLPRCCGAGGVAGARRLLCAPFVSPDGRRLLFLSKRPQPGETSSGPERIWVADRIGGGWSDARPLSDVVNAIGGIHWQISVDAAGTLYFSSCKNLSWGCASGNRWTPRPGNSSCWPPRQLPAAAPERGTTSRVRRRTGPRRTSCSRPWRWR
jgi:hypothetical protein